MARQMIRIKLKAYDHRLIDQSARQIVEAAERTGAAVAGPVPLPTAIEKFCVIRGPHIDNPPIDPHEIDGIIRGLLADARPRTKMSELS